MIRFTFWCLCLSCYYNFPDVFCTYFIQLVKYYIAHPSCEPPKIFKTVLDQHLGTLFHITCFKTAIHMDWVSQKHNLNYIFLAINCKIITKLTCTSNISLVCGLRMKNSWKVLSEIKHEIKQQQQKNPNETMRTV